jgi:hypothetical protein
MTFGSRCALALGLLLNCIVACAQIDASIKLARIADESTVDITQGRTTSSVRRGQRLGDWTLMEIVPSSSPYVVLEDFSRKDGRMLFVTTNGITTSLPKTLEPSTVDPRTLYLGHTLEQVTASDTDLLANTLLAKPGDPSFEEVASAFAPLQKIRAGVFSFIGTPATSEKVGFSIGGRTSYFDPAVHDASIRRIRDGGDVWHGLVGGYLPILRFVYPDSNDSWFELIAFAPFRIVNDNVGVQPVWYRTTRVEGGSVVWSRYNDSYQAFPPRESADAREFYRDLALMRTAWDAELREAMRIDIPDERIANMAKSSLIRSMMTRVRGFPKYGAVEKDYGGNEHDGFLDTFTVETTAMIEWGLLERAANYIDNYFTYFVRDDGSILYRGPETGQFGRALTVLAQFANAGGDTRVLLKHRVRIDAIAKLLMSMRSKTVVLPKNDPAYGLLVGWSEADSALDAEPQRYMQPYFSNSTEAARGFHDLGLVWIALGESTANPDLARWGQRLGQEALGLRRAIDASMSRSRLNIDGRSVLPAIAGVREPFHLAVQRDRADPQHRSYRAYMEMMYSGSLSATDVRAIVDYRANHRDILLGIPTAYHYDSREVAGFLLYGHVYGMIQHDMIREALLATYSDLAHQYTRGQWLAPETRRPLLNEDAAPYCSPAQLIAPLLTRWLLVFEDPERETLWLGKAVPRDWLADGKHVYVRTARTRWGLIDYAIDSHIERRSMSARVVMPEGGLAAETRLRLRVPLAAKMKSVTLNGKAWKRFDAASEEIVIPPRTGGDLRFQVRY